MRLDIDNMSYEVRSSNLDLNLSRIFDLRDVWTVSLCRVVHVFVFFDSLVVVDRNYLLLRREWEL